MESKKNIKIIFEKILSQVPVLFDYKIESKYRKKELF
jgi:hypothetical protein